MPDPYLREKCCLIGETVGGDPTHFMIARALDTLGLDWRFLSFEVPEERLADAMVGVDALGLLGVRLIGRRRDGFAAIADRVDATGRAQRTGRATHLTRHDGRLQADDASGPALIEAMHAIGDARGKRVALVGAEGVGASLADVLIEQGVASLAIADLSDAEAMRLVERAEAWARRPQPVATGAPAGDVSPPAARGVTISRLAWEKGWIEVPDSVDWIVATACWPKEMNAKVVDALAPELHDGHVVVDLAIGSNRSPLLLAAEDRGAATLDGLPILVAETALALEAWTGEAVDRVVLRDAAEEFLGV